MENAVRMRTALQTSVRKEDKNANLAPSLVVLAVVVWPVVFVAPVVSLLTAMKAYASLGNALYPNALIVHSALMVKYVLRGSVLFQVNVYTLMLVSQIHACKDNVNRFHVVQRKIVISYMNAMKDSALYQNVLLIHSAIQD